MSKKITFVISERANRDTFEKGYNAQWNIPALIQAKDTRKGRSGKAYLRYISYEQDIWADKQNTEFDLLKHKHGNAVRLTKPSFIGGFLQVDEDDTLLLDFLRAHPYNVNNAQANGHKGKKFLEINNEQIAKDNLEHARDEFTLMKAIFEMPFEELKTTALITGVLNARDMHSKTGDELRNDLLVLSRRDPEGFYAAIDDDLADYKKLIFEALALKVLIQDGRNSIEYTNGNRFVSVGLGDDVIEAGAEKLADRNNIDVLNMLKRRIRQVKGEDVVAQNEEELEQKRADVKTKKAIKDAPNGNAAEVENLTVESLVGLAADAGIFISKSPYYSLVTNEGEVKLYLGSGKSKWKAAAVEYLEQNEEILEILKTKYFIHKQNS
jgi:hypothetical protein